MLLCLSVFFLAAGAAAAAQTRSGSEAIRSSPIREASLLDSDDDEDAIDGIKKNQQEEARLNHLCCYRCGDCSQEKEEATANPREREEPKDRVRSIREEKQELEPSSK